MAIPMHTEMKDSKPEVHSETGLAVALMFLTVAAYLYIWPDYFVSHIVTRLIGAVFATTGVLGLGIELAKLDSGKRLGVDNLGVGLGFGLLWAVLTYSFRNLFVNIVMFPTLMLAAYGVALAAIQTAKSIRSPLGSGGRLAPKSLLLITGQLAGLVLTVLQIVQIVRGE